MPVSDPHNAGNAGLVKLTKHYADTGIIDDKIVASLREQLVKVQTELAEGSREGIDELKAAFDQFNEQASIDHSAPAERDVQSSVETTEGNKGDVSEERKTRDSAALSSAQRFVQSSYMQTFMHMGSAIVYRGQGKGYFVNDKQYMTLAEAKNAIERKLKFVADRS